ncbi:MAG: hypothetical protein M3253_02490, partial [Chloroflexota bacterium]|nr:hypothetical protein [Chloroflexota bacterium]
MALVERRNLRLSQALSQGNDAGVDHAQGEIAVLRLKLTTTCQIGRGGRFDDVDPLVDILEEDE